MTSISGFSNWVPTIYTIAGIVVILGILYFVFHSKITKEDEK